MEPQSWSKKTVFVCSNERIAKGGTAGPKVEQSGTEGYALKKTKKSRAFDSKGLSKVE